MSSISGHISRSVRRVSDWRRVEVSEGAGARYLGCCWAASYREDTENITQTTGHWVSTYRTAISTRSISVKGRAEGLTPSPVFGRTVLLADVLESAQQEVAESRTRHIDSQGSTCLASSSLLLLTGGECAQMIVSPALLVLVPMIMDRGGTRPSC